MIAAFSSDRSSLNGSTFLVCHPFQLVGDSQDFSQGSCIIGSPRQRGVLLGSYTHFLSLDQCVLTVIALHN